VAGRSSFRASRSIEAILSGDDAWGLAESTEGRPAACAKLSFRRYANGCDSEPVPFLEGIFVRPEFRRQGAGVSLIAHIEVLSRRAESGRSVPTR
jgi:aminoglycoside 6'-N-acetyltransferase I